MKKRMTKILPLIVIAGLVVAIPASTQIWMGSANGDDVGSSLPLLVLVNRLELTTDQMEEMRDVLLGMQESRQEQQARIEAFEQEMIAFDGSAEELDERLEIFRAESREQAELATERVADASDRLAEILTFKQGEILQSALPGLLAGGESIGMHVSSEALQQGGMRGRMPQTSLRGMEEESLGSSLRQRMKARIEEQFEDRPEVLEGLRERFGGLLGDAEDVEAESELGFRGHVEIQVDGQRFGRAFGGHAMQGSLGRSMGGMAGQQVRSNMIEQLIDVLTLKLEAQQ